MSIFTVTLNPAFDVHAQADAFVLHKESRARVSSRDAGGKGINVSRALSENGVDNEAIVLLGRENADEFCKLLDGYGIRYTPFYTEGRIRENITVHVAGEKETRLSFEGFSSGDCALGEIEGDLLPRLDCESTLVFAGSVPEGISHGRIINFLMRVRARGARLVLDSKALTREDLFALRPALIKPNEEEIGALAGSEPKALADYASVARELSLSGIGSAMLSLGEDGALLASSGCVFYARPPKIRALSTVGAGDSTIAGFLCAADRDLPAADCLRYAVSFGTAACLKEGTCPPSPADIDRILPQVEIKEIPFN